MQTVAKSETNSSVLEGEPSAPTATNAVAEKQVASLKSSGLHKVAPGTLKSLKTTYDQTSGHCREFGSFWKAGRLARGSVNCLRIFREVTLILPRAGVAFGNDMAEHFLMILEKIADRFDGNHGNNVTSGKPKTKWLAILFMLCVFTYCFNGLKNFSSGNIIITPSSPKEDKEDKDRDDEKADKVVETALAKKLEDETNRDVTHSSAKPPGSAPFNPQPIPKSNLSEKVLKKVVSEIVKEVLDTK